MNETRKAIIELIEPYFAEWQAEVEITAVLKYIKDKWWFNNRVEIWEKEILFKIFEDKVEWLKYTPLHLYNDQEEKELLELLLKLK